MSNDIGDRRGILYPRNLPRFHRRTPPEALEGYVGWYWISQSELAEGEKSVQRILPFPASNLVVERDKVTLSGPTTGISHQVLTAHGWAFGVLLRPAGLCALGARPDAIVDQQIPIDLGDLGKQIRELMDRDDVDGAAEKMSERLAMRCGEVSHGATLAGRVVDLAAGDPEIKSVGLLADKIGVSTRELQRLARRYVGVSPLRIIRRYRLQEAALRLREDSELTVAAVAAELGYADQSHLAADFRTTLGLSARGYRRET